ncbi:hypothetical protein [Rhizobium leguminosarum]|uniref:hypothetical protein n=1 Tax=Rhizobium leguminosarum TaxID=384 RepID=UPI001C9423E8|nr:hypothetical protein [Rhizobium leguminosarum]MBY5406153.1 hypothetical protein [Rhizobium leguminosarum]
MTGQAKHFGSFPHNVDVVPLALSPRLQPKEGLPDILFRCVAENGFDDVRVINTITGGNKLAGWSHSAMTTRDIDAGRIAQALRVETAVIKSLLYGRTPGLINFFGARMTYSNLSGTRRLSPAYVSEYGHQKAIWGLRCLSFDPQSREVLIDRCPRPLCGRLLTFYRTAGVAFCTHCGADLREYPQAKVEIEDERALDFFTSLIEPSPTPSILDSGDGVLRRFPSGDLFTLVVESAKLLDCPKRPKYPCENRTPGSRYPVSSHSLVEASRAVLNWPEAFLRMARKIKQINSRDNDQRGHPLLIRIPPVYSDLLSFLKKDVNLVCARGEKTSYHFSTAVGDLSNCNFRHPPSVRADAAAMGLPRCEMLRLYQAGEISCPDPTLRKYLGAPETKLLKDVKRFVLEYKKGSDGLPLLRVVLSMRPSKHPWEAIFKAVLKGEICVSFNSLRYPRWSFSRCLLTEDIQSIRDICRSQVSTLNPETEITKNDVLFYLPISMEASGGLRKGGLLPRGKLKLGDVWDLQENCITLPEMHTRLLLNDTGLTNKHLSQAIDAWGLTRIVADARLYRRVEGEKFIDSFIG